MYSVNTQRSPVSPFLILTGLTLHDGHCLTPTPLVLRNHTNGHFDPCHTTPVGAMLIAGSSTLIAPSEDGRGDLLSLADSISPAPGLGRD